MDWRFNTLLWDQLEEQSFRSVDFGNGSKSPCELAGARYVWARRFKSETASLDDLPAAETVTYLELGWANIKSFAGSSRFKGIKRLETHYCLELESDAGISELQNSLEWLHINRSKKFSPGAELMSLSNLRVLCLNSCGPLPDLEFLRNFPHLLDFRFVDANVLSGDLTPMLKHPSLCSVGFLNKRHYNLRDTEIDEHLRPRKIGATQKEYRLFVFPSG